jgi:hypothetical protein
MSATAGHLQVQPQVTAGLVAQLAVHFKGFCAASACYVNRLFATLDVTACSRSIILHVLVLNPPTAVMVVDHKGRILHATAKLSSLLGHPVLNLVKMELNQLLPQPICQMHGAWFKVGTPEDSNNFFPHSAYRYCCCYIFSACCVLCLRTSVPHCTSVTWQHTAIAWCFQDPSLRIPATSCRAGSVVHLLAANGTKVPVTLKLTTKEDTTNGHTTHVVQVGGAGPGAGPK